MTRAARFSLVIGVLLSTSASAENAFTGGPKDAAAVFEAATAKGEVDIIAGLYAPDALLLAPGGQTIAGRDAIRAVHRNNQAAGPNAIRFENVKIDAGDDRAVVLWSWTSRIAPQGRPPIVTKGRSLVYWKRISGVWQITADMFQTAAP